ncbi:MAG TPA: histone-like nucleoid-structuring protein Lsr2 [Pseudonocardiaceae bacterium]|nr:histone-like nucleoid-structuring protein Lsr2 [Pseudonocardiaceae bacterium]
MGTRSIRYCDISGTENDVEVHAINIDQMRVEIDLAAPEYRKLLELLRPYIDAGRVEASASTFSIPAAGPPRKGRRRTRTDLTADERAALRQWAEAKGIPVAANNRFKMSMVNQWRAEASNPQRAESAT